MNRDFLSFKSAFPTNSNVTKLQIIMKCGSTLTFGDETLVDVHLLRQIKSRPSLFHTHSIVSFSSCFSYHFNQVNVPNRFPKPFMSNSWMSSTVTVVKLY